MAALAAARGFAAVKAIQSQGITTGGGTSSYTYGGASGTTALPVGGEPSKPKVTVVLQGGMENMLERINEFVENSDFELIATEAKHAISADALR
jgi:hypothetical protein